MLASDERGVTFKWKDYRLEGRERTFPVHEFIRRFLMHVLPEGWPAGGRSGWQEVIHHQPLSAGPNRD